MKKNKGKIIGKTYIKNVDWNKAVLWKDRQISLPPEEMEKIHQNGVTSIVFHDRKKNLDHVYPVDIVNKIRQFKKVGQEKQFYWDIDSGYTKGSK